MGQTQRLTLSESERAELQALQRQARDVRMYRRLSALLKVDQGDPPELVAEALDVNRASVYRWIERYCRHRHAGDLQENSRSGRPSLLRSVDEKQFDTLLSASPQQYGYRSTIWTVALLRGHLQRDFGISVSDETLRRHLHRQNYRWKRPRYIYHETDPHKGQKKGGSSQH